MSLSARLDLLRFFRPASPELKAAGRRPKGAALGVADRSNPKTRTIVVRVDDATFARIGRAAAKANVTTTEALRQLIARGLDAREG